MICKVCPECGKASYSACEREDSPWICPHCGTDINLLQRKQQQKCAG